MKDLFDRDSGFSLVELLLTVVFVMLGTQMIQAGFLRAADMYGRYSNTLKAVLWSNEQAARSREALLKDEPEGPGSGVWHTPGKDFDWRQSTQSTGGPNLYSLRSELSWSESGKPLKLQKEIYVYKKDLSQGI